MTPTGLKYYQAKASALEAEVQRLRAENKEQKTKLAELKTAVENLFWLMDESCLDDIGQVKEWTIYKSIKAKLKEDYLENSRH